MRRLTALLFTSLLLSSAFGQPYTISTFAGGGLPTGLGGTSASLYGPVGGAAIDGAGNIFFVDQNDVLRLDAVTGALTVAAGNGTPGYSGDNGPAIYAQLNYPRGVAVDSAGNLYIADEGNNCIRKVSNGVIATVPGGGISTTTGGGPTLYGVAVDGFGNLYIADWVNNCIRKVSNGVVSTVAGTGALGFGGDGGPAASAQLAQPWGVAVDSVGNLYIADTGNARIRKVSSGIITTVAGSGNRGFGGDGGPATAASLLVPEGVAVDSAGNLYIADTDNNRVRKVSGGVITTVAGNGAPGFGGDNGPAVSAELYYPTGVVTDSAGNMYIADSANYRIRKISNGVITTVGGNGAPGFAGDNGPANSAQLNQPRGLAADSSGAIYIAEWGNSSRIRKVSHGVITTIAGNGTSGFGGDNGSATSAQVYCPSGVAVDSANNLYIADTCNNRIRKVSNGVITTVVGNGTQGFAGDTGPATSAQLNSPFGVAVASDGSIYIADTNNNRVRKVSNGIITTVAGNGSQGFSGDNGPATSAQLNQPDGVALDSAGNLYVADWANSRIRKISNGTITTVAGTGDAGFSGDNGPATSALLNHPFGIALDLSGTLYIGDYLNHRTRSVSNGVITTVAGNGILGFAGDYGPAIGAELNYPEGVTVDTAGNVYIADTFNNRIRLLTPGTAPSILQGGITPIYSPLSVVQSGSWVSIYGSNLASGTFVWKGDFPTSLGGTRVTIDGKAAFLWYVSPLQINLQVPDDTTIGPANVVVTTASGSASSTVTLSSYGPSFSLLGDGKHVAGEISTPDGTGAYGGGVYDLVGPSGTFSFNTRPVKRGETLILYGVGFGPTSPSVPPGQAFTGAAPTISPVSITIGGTQAKVIFAGIVGAGLYQFNVVVPAAGSGDQALQASVNGIQTPSGAVVTVQ